MDTLNQTPMRSTDLSDPIFDTFKHFWQINEYKEIGWLFPMPMDKVRNGKDGIHIPSSSTPPWSESFYVCPERAPFCKPGQSLLKTKPRISYWQWLIYKAYWILSLTGCQLLKWGHLVAKKKWDPEVGIETFGKSGWRPNETGNMKPLNSDASPLPLEADFPPSLEGINSTLPGETAVASTEGVALQDNVAFPQNPTLPPLFASKPVTGLKFQQDSKGEVQSTTHKGELLKFTNLHRQKSQE